ncbi:MAG: hypothetical protein ABI691_00710 [Ginsengibacter sp.]
MAQFKKYTLALVFLSQLLLQNTGCQKEYSCESCDSTIILIDSLILPPPPLVIYDFPQCDLCKPGDGITLSHWNFKSGNSFFCGLIGDAGLSPDKTAFTFFGPSACSIDTGLVMTIYLPIAFDTDKYNVTTTKIAFFYYDHFGPRDIFLSLPEKLFTVNIVSYIKSTGIVTGTFRGIVFKPNGDTTFVDQGNFIVNLK